MKEKVLIVDDEKDIARMLEYNLKKEGFGTLTADDGENAIRLSKKERPDIVVLDLMLPGIDGLEVCRVLKSEKATALIPIIMLTAKAREIDKVVGLELGADDYVTKPFSIQELIARIKAVLRRGKEQGPKSLALSAGGLKVDLNKIKVSVKGRNVEITSKEFELLRTLIEAKGRVLSREYLLNAVWGFDNAVEIQTRTIDVHIRTLRKKLKGEAKRIVTVKNYGYRFETEQM